MYRRIAEIDSQLDVLEKIKALLPPVARKAVKEHDLMPCAVHGAPIPS